MTQPVRIAQLSCGPEYSGIQHEIDEAAREVGGEIFYPDVALKDIRRDFTKFGLDVKSPDLKLAIALGHPLTGQELASLQRVASHDDPGPPKVGGVQIR